MSADLPEINIYPFKVYIYGRRGPAVAPKEKSDPENWREEGYVGKARKEMAIPTPPVPPREIREMCPGKGTGKTKGKPGEIPCFRNRPFLPWFLPNLPRSHGSFLGIFFAIWPVILWKLGLLRISRHLDDRSTDSNPKVKHFPYSSLQYCFIPLFPLTCLWRSKMAISRWEPRYLSKENKKSI